MSATGFKTWRRGVKRNTNFSASAGSTTVGGTSGARTGSTSRNATGRVKKGLGMGLQGTPARKRVKRDSRKSKVSILFSLSDAVEGPGRIGIG